MYEQVLTPNVGPMTNPSLPKSTFKETQQNPYIIDFVRRRKVKYWYKACTSLERAGLLSKETTIHSLPKN